MMSSRRRRTSLSGSRRNRSGRTPDILYIVLIALCIAGAWLTRDTNVRSVSGHVLNAYNGEPIDGATVNLHADAKAVKASGLPADATTGTSAGFFKFGDTPTGITLTATADDYIGSKPVALDLKKTGNAGATQDIRLVPTTLHGVILDPAGKPVPHAYVTLTIPGTKPQTIITTADGTYMYRDVPADCQISVRAAGYSYVALALHHTDRRDITLQPFQVKGIYVNNFTASDDGDFGKLTDMLDHSEINTVVIDVKNFLGNVFFPSKTPGAEAVTADKGLITDLAGRIKTLHTHGIYTVARLVVFQDSILTIQHPDWAIQSKKGGIWHDGGNVGWANPYKKEVWDYNLALAQEVADLGFDEIQFDTIHFPPSGDLSDASYGQPSTADSRVKAIHDFLTLAEDTFAPQGVYISADLFGLTTIDASDLGLGQKFLDLAPLVDYVSPILYPAQWGAGSFNIDRPAEHPGDIVLQSLQQGGRRLSGTTAHLRPWLQDFTLGTTKYGEKEVRDQIDAVGKAVTAETGWLLWNPNSTYTSAALNANDTTRPTLPGHTDPPVSVTGDTPPSGTAHATSATPTANTDATQPPDATPTPQG